MEDRPFYIEYIWVIVTGLLMSCCIPACCYISYKLVFELILPICRGEDDVSQFNEARRELMTRLERLNSASSELEHAL